MPLDAVRREKILRFSVRPSGGDPPHPSAGETLVLAEPRDSLAKAFSIAASLLDRGLAVRVVASGVTLPRAWPPWVTGATRLTLTEIGAFRTAPELEATQTLQDELRTWIRGVFRDGYGDVSPERVYFAAACNRFFQHAVNAFPIAQGIAEAFPSATVHCVRPHSLTAGLLHELLASSAGSVAGRRAWGQPLALWRASVACLGLAGAAIAVLRVTEAYLRARPTFRGIRAAHREKERVEAPATWVAVVPDWYRINHHLLDAFALPETNDGTALGVLFVGSLAPFQRDEANQRRHHASDLWPGLGRLRERLNQCQVEQAVMPERPLDFARAVGLGLSRSARALRRVSAEPGLPLPSAYVGASAPDVVRWVTLDVLRATLSEVATRALLARVPMAGRTVLFVAGNSVTSTSVDVLLQASGATTVDHPHGTGGDQWSAASWSESAVRLLWTLADARTAAGPGVRTLVSGMPLRFDMTARARPARRILVTTSYVHRDAQLPVGVFAGDNRHPARMFQPEMLDIIRLLRRRGHRDLEFRWRPHPADDEAEVQADFATLEGVELSRGRPLDEDAAWADVVVSSISTVIVETMFAGVPVFVHVLPELSGAPATSFLAPTRVFFHAEDGARRIAEWLDRFQSCPADGLSEERAARIALFGDTGAPVPLTAFFGHSRTREVSLARDRPGAPLAVHVTPGGEHAARGLAPAQPRTA